MLALQLHDRPFLGWDIVAYGTKFSVRVRWLDPKPNPNPNLSPLP